MVDKLKADYLGEPQIKVVENYAQYIITIAEARSETFYKDKDYETYAFWLNIAFDAKKIQNRISKYKDTLFDG